MYDGLVDVDEENDKFPVLIDEVLDSDITVDIGFVIVVNSIV